MQSSENSLWLSFDEMLLAPVLKDQSLVRLRKKHPIFYQGDMTTTVYVVKEGRVCITTYSMTGLEQQLYIAEHGTLFGERSCLLNSEHMTTAVSIVDSVVYAIPNAVFRQCLQEDIALNRAVHYVLCRKNSLLIERLLSQSSSNSLQRIAQMLLDMFREYSIDTNEGTKISIRFSHQDVANLLHISRVTVTKTFQTLYQNKIICRKNGYIFMLEAEKLMRLASGELQI